MRVVTDDGVGLEVDERGSGPTLAAGARLRRREGGLRRPRSTRCARVTRRDLRPPRPRRERQPDRSGRVLARPARGRHARRSPTRSALDRFRLLGHSMGGMVVRRSRPGASRAGRRARADGHVAGPGARHRPRADGDGRGDRAQRGQGRAEADHGRVPAARHARVQADCWRSGPATRSSTTGSGRRCRRSCGRRSAVRSGTSPTSWPRSAAVRCPTLVIVGEQDEPFLGVSQRDGGRRSRARSSS